MNAFEQKKKIKIQKQKTMQNKRLGREKKSTKNEKLLNYYGLKSCTNEHGTVCNMQQTMVKLLLELHNMRLATMQPFILVFLYG